MEAQSFTGFEAICFRVEATFPSGSVAWTDFQSIRSQVEAAPLLDWRAAPRIDGGVLQFEPPVPFPEERSGELIDGVWHLGVHLTHRAQVLTADGGLAWQADDRFQLPDASYAFAREPLVVDAARLEDFDGTLRLSATLIDADQRPSGIGSLQGASPVELQAGQQVPLRGALVPVSRGLGCPRFATPCPLTDGDLTVVDAGLATEVELELARPAVVSSVVLRGARVINGLIRTVVAEADGGVVLDVTVTVPESSYSAFDPTRSSPFVNLADGGYGIIRLGYVVIPLDAGAPAGRVTLQFPDGLVSIQEVSLFE